MMTTITNDDRIKLAHALTVRAARSSDMNKEAAVRLRTKMAFVDELIKIDPNMEKLAWSLPSLSDVGNAIGGAARYVGSGIASGASKAWNYAKENPWETALTAAMFIPGLNIAAGAGRAAMLAGKAGLYAHRAYKGAQGAKALATAGKTLNMGGKAVRAIKNTVGGLRAGASRARTVFGRAASNPINNQIGLMGMRGTSMTGRALGAGQRSLLRGSGMTQRARSANAWRNLGRGGKALRVGGLGLAATDIGGAASGINDIANHQVGQTSGLSGGARYAGSRGKMQATRRNLG